MDALEKLRRLTNPKTLEDWGLSVSLSDLAESDEGREWVRTFYRDYVPITECPGEMRENG